jgi:hypothetical protein
MMSKEKIKKKPQKGIAKDCNSCNKKILIRYNTTTGEFAKKNDWFYWTEKEENKDKYVCNSCLIDLYYNNPKEYLELVENKKKRRIFTTYIYNKAIS